MIPKYITLHAFIYGWILLGYVIPKHRLLNDNTGQNNIGQHTTKQNITYSSRVHLDLKLKIFKKKGLKLWQKRSTIKQSK